MIPVLAGMPWLAGVLGGLFSSLFNFFATYITKRFAIIAAAVLVIVALTSAFFAALQAMVAGLSLVVPSSVVQLAAFVLPSNVDECASIVVASRLLRYAYDWNIKIIQYKLF